MEKQTKMETTGSKREDTNKVWDKKKKKKCWSPEEPLLDAYQVRFGGVPTHVGLPQTQRSIGINDAKLQHIR